ncbi:MAG: MBL fold metallo-hydrolase [Burkholderiales bacterium]|nr:MAG: MBL fold metallo-hydrolase [Burkholderiales bacterium]
MTPDREALERRLHYPLEQQLPGIGQALTVAPGVKWVRMALPFALDHINLWLLRDRLDGRDGWTIVDCCIAHDSAREQWEQIFAQELDGLPVLRVLVTHMHPDHIGLAQWLCERWQAPLLISATDYHMARLGSQSTTGFGGEAAARHFARHGLNDPESQQRIRARSAYYPGLVPGVPATFSRLLDGTHLAIGGHGWRCIAGYGHAPEHMALYCEALGVLISGDMVLPRISTNVSVYDQEPEADALSLFLTSLERFLPLPEDTLVLPSHGKPFKGLHERIRQLQEHHQERLREVTQACQQQACSAMDIIPVLFPRALDLHQTTFAMGEAIAHLHRLWYQGHLHREQGADGVFRFTTAG